MKLESKLEVGQLAFFIDEDIIKMGVVQTVNYEKNKFWYKIALGLYTTHDEWEEGVFVCVVGCWVGTGCESALCEVILWLVVIWFDGSMGEFACLFNGFSIFRIVNALCKSIIG